MALNVVFSDEQKFVVSLESDGGDLDIYVNDTLIAYLSDFSGRLILMEDVAKDLEGSGIAFDAEGRVQLG